MLSGSQLKEQQVPDKAPRIHLFLSPSSSPSCSFSRAQHHLCSLSALSSSFGWSQVWLRVGIDVDINIWQPLSLGRKQNLRWELSPGEDANHDHKVQLQFPVLSKAICLLPLLRIPLFLWGMKQFVPTLHLLSHPPKPLLRVSAGLCCAVLHLPRATSGCCAETEGWAHRDWDHNSHGRRSRIFPWNFKCI